ncbi:CLUMA_CG018418, isoform A [Clunio marinus]|uniref:CLUMA_CG018418, isoform A n=1 Tax=Clunio marinus TaxID=568069 RepID=A0A1J1IZH2_9DIPT|nr:CLUMA_CG018418, isoform A [Clunio marinus]
MTCCVIQSLIVVVNSRDVLMEITLQASSCVKRNIKAHSTTTQQDIKQFFHIFNFLHELCKRRKSNFEDSPLT